MALSRATSVLNIGVPVLSKRNFASSYIFNNKVTDPVQLLFLEKIKEFNAKIKDKNFVKQYPELQKSLDEELNRVTRQYGGNTSEDLMKFPEVHLEDYKIDPQPGF